MSYGDYVEQLTYLLFLKMADERTKPPFNQKGTIPKEYSWPILLSKDGDELEVHYRHTLEQLGKKPGMLGIIFRKAQNKIQDPAKLRRLIVDLIDHEKWMNLDADVKGDAYEGLLQKNAEDVKSGAGQYFTPRPLIEAVVDCMKPGPDDRICDPACGTGGFLLAHGTFNDSTFICHCPPSVLTAHLGSVCRTGLRVDGCAASPVGSVHVQGGIVRKTPVRGKAETQVPLGLPVKLRSSAARIHKSATAYLLVRMLLRSMTLELGMVNRTGVLLSFELEE
jgi:hypothetical protein